jgi:small nuclear ribonucleoprotein (snRNP)-like protein
VLKAPFLTPVIDCLLDVPKAQLRMYYGDIGGNLSNFTEIFGSDGRIWAAVKIIAGDYSETLLDSDGYLLNAYVPMIGDPYIIGRYDYFNLPYLPDGDTLVKLQACDNNGAWCTWAQTTITVINVPPDEITLSAVQSGNGINLSWAENEAFTAYYIFRDDVMIATTAGIAYTDNFAGAGEHVYSVRGVDGTYYADSNEVTINVSVNGAYITPVDTIDWLSISLRAGEPYGHGQNNNGNVVYNTYSGRPKPVASISNNDITDNTLAISTIAIADRQKLRSMLNKTVFVKTSRGDSFFGVLDKIGNSINTQYTDLTIHIGETDYQEEITYE